MNKYLMPLALMSSISAHAYFAPDFLEDQFPIDAKNYQSSKDIGFAQYQTKQLFGTKKIVLTFDDGPDETTTPILLDILKKYDVKATFFVNTQKINESNKWIIKRILKEGHLIGSHDHNHTNNNEEDEINFHHDLKKSFDILENLEEEFQISQKEVYFRFPYGAYGTNSQYHHLNVMKDVSKQLYNENCINFVFWDIDTADWTPGMEAQMISQNIKASLFGGTSYTFKEKKFTFFSKNPKNKFKIVKRNTSSPVGGGIVLMHDVHQNSVQAVDIFLKENQDNGVEIVALNTLNDFNFNDKKCEYQKREY